VFPTATRARVQRLYREEMLDVRIRPIVLADAAEVFTLQRAAFIEEAHLYDTVDTPALTQTFDELKAELATHSGCVALMGSRMVGSVTARLEGDVLAIGRLAVVPDLQGRGIGTRLLDAVEARSGAAEATLYTGALSGPNLRLYQRLGYVETHRVTLPEVELVYLRKRLTTPERPAADPGNARP
jgi:ribosomal protein S18 acetylase RimI-like enzyme